MAFLYSTQSNGKEKEISISSLRKTCMHAFRARLKALGDCSTSRPKGCSQPRELRFVIVSTLDVYKTARAGSLEARAWVS
jgi:hypothetical protein